MISWLVPVLIVCLAAADVATGRRGGYVCTVLNVAAVALVPQLVAPLMILLQRHESPALSWLLALYLLEICLCLRLMTVRCRAPGGSGGAAELWAAHRLMGFAMSSSLLALGLALLNLAAWFGMLGGIMGELEGLLHFEVLDAMGAGERPTLLQAVQAVCTLVVPVGVMFAMLLLQWVYAAVPAVLGLRGFLRCQEALALSHLEQIGYAVLLVVPGVSAVPLLLLRRRCRALGGQGGAV